MRRTLWGKWGDGGFGSGGGGGGRSAGSYSDGGGSYYSDHDAVRGWDRAYLIAAAKREACGVDANAVAQYFPIDKVLKGVAALLSRVFNVHLREVKMEQGESWHEGVRKLRVAAGGGGAGDGEDVGTIYLDLAPRPRKFPHAAHFVIQARPIHWFPYDPVRDVNVDP
jgi:Zn-dependent oligopeptidase